MKVTYYEDKFDRTAWEALVKEAHTGTFLHSRKFLDYHGTRFTDRSVVVRDDNHSLVAVLPAAIDPSAEDRVVSHPGATFGGLLTCKRDSFAGIQAIHKLICAFYRSEGFDQFVYKTVPQHLHRRLAGHDHYYMWSSGSQLIRRDLWNVLFLNSARTLSKGRKWSLNKAKKESLLVETTVAREDVFKFHEVLSERLRSAHSTQPVHTADEICDLMHRFPDQIQLWTIKNKDYQLLAGVLLFNLSEMSPHTQYIATTDDGRDTYAGDLLIARIIEHAEKRGASYFSFGSSTEQEGIRLNEGLFDYKSGFGVGSVVHDIYCVELSGN